MLESSNSIQNYKANEGTGFLPDSDSLAFCVLKQPTEYKKFLQKKRIRIQSLGFNPIWIPDYLFDFQRDLTSWAIRKGKAAIWAGCGLGKTNIQLVWSENVVRHTGKPVLILAPLAVSKQTKQEGLKINLDVTVCESQSDVNPTGINITNYEKLHKFDSSAFVGVVLDESSILKNFAGKTKEQIINAFYNTDYKLCCSATPSPNDYTEIGNHADFLNVCSRTEMLATYFVHDGGDTQKWRLKGHAEKEFFRWISQWAVMIEKPSDLGYSDQIMTLPPLNMFEHIVESVIEDELFVTPAQTLNERRDARRKSIESRCALAASLNNSTDESFLNWCDLNAESDTLTKMINGGVEVKGSDKNEIKEKRLMGFATGEVKKLITKASIAQFGLNWQICHNMCFVGLSDSFEAFYQALRRCYRFGQTKPVNVHIIISEKEGNVLQNIKRKEQNAKMMLDRMIQHISINTIDELKKETIKTQSKSQKFQLPSFIQQNNTSNRISA